MKSRHGVKKTREDPKPELKPLTLALTLTNGLPAGVIGVQNKALSTESLEKQLVSIEFYVITVYTCIQGLLDLEILTY